MSTDTGALTGLTARIVASTNLICLHGESVGGVESSILPQRADVTLEGELDCPALDRSVSKPSLSPSYEQQAVRDEALLDVWLCSSAPRLNLPVRVVASVVATTGFVGLVSSARDTHPPDAGNEAAPGEGLGGVDSSILLMDEGVGG